MEDSINNYFVILNHQKDHIKIPVMDENDNLKLFGSSFLAKVYAETTVFGNAFGYEIFQFGDGQN